ncbi:hypothetical protein FH969_11470 [Miniimonas arenae]|uniref:Uncharacterized protein n=1 Tax=Miniimonas arenae TaxID=676201 RepID=A0A5C5BBP8_9MICO|nr:MULTISPECIES: hypothetical protein [Miniimonas]TNU73405.1 hypothetical protein FH969_11470 [Miniimonas arenae]
MPTGPKHQKYVAIPGEPGSFYAEDCRCMIGEDHDDDNESGGESLSVWDAADIWMSNGMDEDYTFGFSGDELRRAAGMD